MEESGQICCYGESRNSETFPEPFDIATLKMSFLINPSGQDLLIDQF